MRSAMALMLRGELITAPPPNHCVLRSSVQISGLSSTVSGADFRRREQRARSCLGRLVVARDEAPARARRQVDSVARPYPAVTCHVGVKGGGPPPRYA
jgi:hypothetical protein